MRSLEEIIRQNARTIDPDGAVTIPSSLLLQLVVALKVAEASLTDAVNHGGLRALQRSNATNLDLPVIQRARAAAERAQAAPATAGGFPPSPRGFKVPEAPAEPGLMTRVFAKPTVEKLPEPDAQEEPAIAPASISLPCRMDNADSITIEHEPSGYKGFKIRGVDLGRVREVKLSWSQAAVLEDTLRKGEGRSLAGFEGWVEISVLDNQGMVAIYLRPGRLTQQPYSTCVILNRDDVERLANFLLAYGARR